MESLNVAPSSTAVDGQGMWRSWTRVFGKQTAACLDLLDNCFDAALHEGFAGRVVMEEWQQRNGGSGSYSNNHNSILIQNNSVTPVKKLQDALTVYKSSKNAATTLHEITGKEDIGENGVGLKQGCATLSDCSIVLTRNHGTVEIGIIAKQLQSTRGVYLPSFSFQVDVPTNTNTQLNSHEQEHIQAWLAENPSILKCLEQTFKVNTCENVSQDLSSLVQRMFMPEWRAQDYVFLLVMCNIKRGEMTHELITSASPAKDFLQEIKNMLPEYYLNLPEFHFVIDGERMHFNYWQRRLVELTRFQVYIPTNQDFEKLPEENWDQPGPNKYKLNIYCGFDAQRVNRDLTSGKGTSTCYLCIYSRLSGRLIQKEIDARHLLGLSSSGVDYTQGLTVIINDITGKLPLTPTKDGIAWSEQATGEVHRRNLLAWAGAVAQLFWTHHRNALSAKNGNSNKIKEIMKKTIRSFAIEDQRELADSMDTSRENLEDAKVTEFQGIKWKRVQSTYGLYWNIRRQSSVPFTVYKGPDTLFCIGQDRVRRIKNGNNPSKRKAVAIPSVTDDDNSGPVIPLVAVSRDNSNDNDRGGPGESKPWPEVPVDAIPRVTKGMLEFLRGMDKDDLFEVPVVEAMPQLKDSYLKVVSTPMDFKTIEEQRMPAYKSIVELQKDLILVFENCIRFNGASSVYGEISTRMLDVLDDGLESVLFGKRSRKRVNYQEIQNQYNDMPLPKRYKPIRNNGREGSSSTMVAQLRRLLQAERSKVEELQKQLAASERRILELEGRPIPEAVPDTTLSADTSGCARRDDDDDGCAICGRDDDHRAIMLCDSCDSEYHYYCLNPPLPSVPTGSWYCGRCTLL